MELTVRSRDGVNIHAEVSGRGATALVFVHGWLGSGRWWDAQRGAFADTHTIVQIDLAGHGASGRERTYGSVEAYAEDIKAVVEQVECPRIILVGHSMSGSNVVEASLYLDRAAAIVLVDTLKNVEQVPSPAETEAMLALYRRDFRATIENVVSKFLFAPQTPADLVARLTREFLAVPGEIAASLLEPFYRYDVREPARQVRVPVRAINSDLHPTDIAANQRWFSSYAMRLMPGVGHYPMLEQPATFNDHLRSVLDELAG